MPPPFQFPCQTALIPLLSGYLLAACGNLAPGQSVQAYDGRETAPAAADENLFLRPDGQPMAFIDGVLLL